MPAAEEFGLLLKDYVATWRRNNRVSIVNKAKMIADRNKSVPEGSTAAPRIVFEILEKGSLSDEERIQSLWAGLLVSSCSPKGDDQTNLIYTQILERLIGIESVENLRVPPVFSLRKIPFTFGSIRSLKCG